jgi:hypothetical protein
METSLRSMSLADSQGISQSLVEWWAKRDAEEQVGIANGKFQKYNS